MRGCNPAVRGDVPRRICTGGRDPVPASSAERELVGLSMPFDLEQLPMVSSSLGISIGFIR
jgi:hypothetical protein